MRKLLGLTAFIGVTAGIPSLAQAGEVTRIASSAEEDNPFDLHAGVNYEFDFRRASILREWSNNGSNRLVRDLAYKQQRQTVTPNLEIGLYHDLSVYAVLPIVVADNRSYSLDQSEGEDCIYPAEAAAQNVDPTCVNKTNSTSIRDSIIPANGWDALDRGAAYEQFTEPNEELIFRTPTRRGIDQLHVGLKYGILNQSKLSHLPNWVVALEGRFAVGKKMTFTRDVDLSDPDANHRVGRRIHELGAWTALSRRFRYLDPFFGAYWRMAVRANKTEFSNLPNQSETNPPQIVGSYFGAEIIAWENPEKLQKFAIFFQGTGELQTRGRNYSEAWEILADSPALVGTDSPAQGDCNVAASINYANANLDNPDGYLDAANSASTGVCQKFSGITTVDTFAKLGLTTSMNFWLGKYARLNIGAHLRTQTRHFITGANRGDPSRDPSTDPDTVDSGTVEVNPVRRDIIDNVGRRYALDNVLQVVGFANFLLTF
jgi:hypothetical protein